MKSLSSILIATDFSAEGLSAVRRAAHIARETGARGTLVHALPGTLPAAMHVQAATLAHDIEHALLGSVALQVLETAACDVLIAPSA